MTRKKNMPWERIVELVKHDAEAKDYLVDFLDQVDSIDHTVYVYFKNDDMSSIYALNDQHRAQLEDAIEKAGIQDIVKGPKVHTNNVNEALLALEVGDIFWSELNEHYRMTN